MDRIDNQMAIDYLRSTEHKFPVPAAVLALALREAKRIAVERGGVVSLRYQGHEKFFRIEEDEVHSIERPAADIRVACVDIDEKSAGRVLVRIVNYILG